MGSRIFRCELDREPDAEAVAEALAALPAWRLEKALAFRQPLDRFLCAKAYLLLKDALRESYGLDGDFTFVYGPSGKPSLKEHPDIHFNISHCRRCVCCIVSSSPVGVDVEEIQYDAALARSVFNDEEMKEILASERRDIAFTRLWTMKESFLKLTGNGLSDDLKRLLSGQTPAFDIEIAAERGYVLCTAMDK